MESHVTGEFESHEFAPRIGRSARNGVDSGRESYLYVYPPGEAADSIQTHA